MLHLSVKCERNEVICMPTLKPRVHVVLEPALYDVVRRIGDRQGKSASKVLRELIEPSEPVLRQIADTLDRLHGLEGEDLRKASTDAARSLTGGALDEFQKHQMTIFDVQGVGREDAPDGPAGPPGAPAAAGASTPASNTGVTCSESSSKKRVKS